MVAKAETDPSAGGRTALIIIDMINDLEFDGGSDLLPAAKRAAEAILDLSGRARANKVPVVYVNDNYGQWHSERSRIVEHAAREGARGRELVRMLQPDRDDYFVIKPQFSGFYSTNLPVLLPKLGASRLILTGAATDICVLFTAADAHMRDYDLWVPRDCVASADPQRTDWALEIMADAMEAEVRPTGDYTLADWLARDG